MSGLQYWEKELMKALQLVRDFRLKSVVQNIDPRASRAALKYALMVDTYLSKQHGLTAEEDQKLTEIAEELFRKTPQVALQEEYRRQKKK